MAEQNNPGDIHWKRASHGGGKPEYLAGISESHLPRLATPSPLTEQKIDLVNRQIATK